MGDSISLRVSSIQPVVDPAIARSIEHELGGIYQVPVQASSWDSEPPAAGMSEIAFTIVATGAVSLLVKFFEPIVTEAGEAFRDKALELIKTGRKSRVSGRVYIPLQIGLGSDPPDPYPSIPVRYYFHGQIDDDGLLYRFRAANHHLQSLPPNLLEGEDGPGEYGFFWDNETDSWRGSVWRQPDQLYGEFWLPDDLWDE